MLSFFVLLFLSAACAARSSIFTSTTADFTTLGAVSTVASAASFRPFVTADGKFELALGHPDENTIYIRNETSTYVLIDVSTLALLSSARFSSSISYAADVNGDSVYDLAVGAPGSSTDRGSVFVIFLNSTKGIKSFSEIPAPIAMSYGSNFGSAVDMGPDMNGDRIPDLAVGASAAIGDGGIRGCVFLVFLSNAGAAKSFFKIGPSGSDFSLTSMTVGGLFGFSISVRQNPNFDGVVSLVVGAPGEDSGAGGVHFFFLGRDSPVENNVVVTSHVQITRTVLSGDIDSAAAFGYSLSLRDDLNGDNVPDLLIGAPGTNSGSGGIYLVFLGGSGAVLSHDKITSGSTPFTSLFSSGSKGFGAVVALRPSPKVGQEYMVIGERYPAYPDTHRLHLVTSTVAVCSSSTVCDAAQSCTNGVLGAICSGCPNGYTQIGTGSASCLKWVSPAVSPSTGSISITISAAFPSLLSPSPVARIGDTAAESSSFISDTCVIAKVPASTITGGAFQSIVISSALSLATVTSSYRITDISSVEANCAAYFTADGCSEIFSLPGYSELVSTSTATSLSLENLNSLSLPTTGSVSLTVFGGGFPTNTKSESVRVASTASEATSWVSSSSLLIKAGATSRASKFVLSVASSPFALSGSHTAIRVSSYGLGYGVGVGRGDNGPRTGAAQIVAVGIGFISGGNPSLAVNLAGTACENIGGAWLSDTSLRCKNPAGFSANPAASPIVVTCSVRNAIYTNSIFFTYDSADASAVPVPSNIPLSGAVSVTLSVSVAGPFSHTHALRFSGTTAESTLWVSSSSLLAKISNSNSNGPVVSVTISRIASTNLVGFSVDEIGCNGVTPTVTPVTGGASITVSAVGFSSRTLSFRLTASAAEATNWMSSTSLAARPAGGNLGVKNLEIFAVTAAGSFSAQPTGTLTSGYDYSSLSKSDCARTLPDEICAKIAALPSRVLLSSKELPATATFYGISSISPTGATSLSIIGSHYGIGDGSTKLRVVSSAVESSRWSSDSSVSSKISRSVIGWHSAIFSVGKFIGPSTSFDSPIITDTSGFSVSTPITSPTLTISAVNTFGSYNPSPVASVGNQNCLATTWVSASSVLCRQTPLSGTGTISTFSVEIGGAKFSKFVSLSYSVAASGSFAVDSISPSYGETSGGSTVTIFGSGFSAGLSCTFGSKSALVSATYLNSNSLTCVSPSVLNNGLVSVGISSDSGTTIVTGSAAVFLFFKPPIVSYLDPSVVRLSGSKLNMAGCGFSPVSNSDVSLRVDYYKNTDLALSSFTLGSRSSLGATPNTHVSILSTVDSLPGLPPETFYVAASLGSNSTKNSDVFLTTYESPAEKSSPVVSPRTVSGGTIVSVTGLSLIVASPQDRLCSFMVVGGGAHSVPMTYDSANATLKCVYTAEIDTKIFGASPDSGSVYFMISFNGNVDAHILTTLDRAASTVPTLTAVSPALFSSDATITAEGTNFIASASSAVCVFGSTSGLQTAATVLSSTKLQCSAGAQILFGASKLYVSMDQLTFSNGIVVTVHEPTNFTAIEPSAVPTSAISQTNFTFVGTLFSSYNFTPVVSVENCAAVPSISANILSFYFDGSCTPSVGAHPVSISMNGFDSKNTSFLLTIFDPVSYTIHPSVGNSAGGTTVFVVANLTLVSSLLGNSSSVICKFGSTEVGGGFITVGGATAGACVVPSQLVSGSMKFTWSFTGSSGYHPPADFEIISTSLSSISPTIGPSSGGTSVVLTGTFTPGINLYAVVTGSVSTLVHIPSFTSTSATVEMPTYFPYYGGVTIGVLQTNYVFSLPLSLSSFIDTSSSQDIWSDAYLSAASFPTMNAEIVYLPPAGSETFYYLQPFIFQSVTPKAALSGSTVSVTIAGMSFTQPDGSNFAGNSSCPISCGINVVTPTETCAEFSVTRNRITCSISATSGYIYVAFGDVQVNTNIFFTSYSIDFTISGVSPTTAEFGSSGGTITVIGTGFSDPAGQLACKIGSTEATATKTSATLTSNEQILCVVPQPKLTPPYSLNIYLTFNGDTYTNTGQKINYISSSATSLAYNGVSSRAIEQGNSDGLLVVVGTGFSPGVYYQAEMVAPSGSVTAFILSYFSSQQLMTDVSSLNELGTYTVNLLVSGTRQTYVSTGTYLQTVIIYGAQTNFPYSTSFVSATGGTVLSIYPGAWPSSYYTNLDTQCQFMNTFVTAQMSFSGFTCVVPARSVVGVNYSINYAAVTYNGFSVSYRLGPLYYFDPPTLASISPLSFPAAEDVVVNIYGTGFRGTDSVRVGTDTSLTGSKAADVISDTHIAVTMNLAQQTYTFYVSLNKIDTVAFTSSTIQVYAGETVSSISPRGFKISGGASLTLTGSFTAVSPVCKFVVVSAPAIVVPGAVNPTATTLTCLVPKLSSTSVTVEISSNNYTFFSPSVSIQPFFFNEPAAVSVSPLIVSTLGGTSITISGDNVAFATLDSTTRCIFGTLSVSVSKIDRTGPKPKIICAAPKLPEQTIPLYINLNGQTADSSLVGEIKILTLPSVSSVSPPGVPVGTAATTITIRGTGFVSSLSYTCVFGTISPVSVAVFENGFITCDTPVILSPTTVNVSISFNNGADKDAGVPFYFYNLGVVSSIFPWGGPFIGNTLVTLTGATSLSTDFLTNSVAALRCRFRSNSIGTIDVVGGLGSNGTVVCTSPNITSDAPTAVELILMQNGVHESSPVTFQYYENSPVISAIVPLAASAAGGSSVTFSGNFPKVPTPQLLCEFKGVAVVGSVADLQNFIYCTLPQVSPGSSGIRLTFNTQQWHPIIFPDAAAKPSNLFDHFKDPVVTGIFPVGGPYDGGNVVTVFGRDLTPEYGGVICAFGSTSDKYVDAEFIDNFSVTCAAPFSESSSVVLSLILNGVDMTRTNANYTYFTQPSLSHIDPLGGPISGGTEITVFGSLFQNSSLPLNLVMCLFGTEIVPADVINDTTLVCVSPSFPITSAGPNILSVAVNNDTFIPDDGTVTLPQYYAYDRPRVKLISPTSGPIVGGTIITLEADNFLFDSNKKTGAYGYDYVSLVQIGNSVVRATRVGSQYLTFITPPSEPGNVNISLSLNWQDWDEIPPTVPQRLFEFYGNDLKISLVVSESTDIEALLVKLAASLGIDRSRISYSKTRAFSHASRALLAVTLNLVIRDSPSSPTLALASAITSLSSTVLGGTIGAVVNSGTVVSISPSSGPSYGPSAYPVTIFGAGFNISNSNLKCRFGNSTVSGQRVSDSMIICATIPATDAATCGVSCSVNVELLLNGVDASTSSPRVPFIFKFTCSVGTRQLSVNGALTTACVGCPAGTYADTEGLTACINCAAGTFSVNSNRTTSCTDTCEKGSYSLAGQSSCTACDFASGLTAQSRGSSSCLPCPAGQYAFSPSSCSPCPEHTFQPNISTTACVKCPLGKLRSVNDSALSCVDCAAVSTQIADSTYQCVCRPGTEPSTTASTDGLVCAACGSTTFKATIGNDVCITCPDAVMISLPPATSVSSCQCSQGYWSKIKILDYTKVAPDIFNPSVIARKLTYLDIHLEKKIETPSDEYAGKVCAACPGGTNACNDNSVCNPGHIGTLCAVCDTSNPKKMYYKAPEKHCVVCPPPSNYAVTAIIVVIGVVAALVFFKKVGIEFFKLLPLGTIKIFTSYFVVMSSIQTVYHAKIPINLKKYFAKISFFNLDVSSGANCVALVPFTFYQRFISIVCSWIAVIFLATIIFYGGLIFRQRGPQWKALVMKWMLFALTLIHPNVSSTLFQILNCDESLLGYSSWLREDYSLECLTTEWWVYTFIGFASAVAFTFGYPLSLLLALRKRSKTVRQWRDRVQAISEREYDEKQLGIFPTEEEIIVRNAEDASIIRRFLKCQERYAELGFLHEDYLPAFYFAEILETIRKVFLTSFAVIIGHYFRGFDIIFGIVVLSVFFGVHVFMWPYRHLYNNWLRTTELCAEYGTLFALMLNSISKDAKDYNTQMIDYILIGVQVVIVLAAISTIIFVGKESWKDLYKKFRRFFRSWRIRREMARNKNRPGYKGPISNNKNEIDPLDFATALNVRLIARRMLRRARARIKARALEAQREKIELAEQSMMHKALSAHQEFLATGAWPAWKSSEIISKANPTEPVVLRMPKSEFLAAPKVLRPPAEDAFSVENFETEMPAFETNVETSKMGPRVLSMPSVRSSVSEMGLFVFTPSSLSYSVNNRSSWRGMFSRQNIPTLSAVENVSVDIGFPAADLNQRFETSVLDTPIENIRINPGLEMMDIAVGFPLPENDGDLQPPPTSTNLPSPLNPISSGFGEQSFPPRPQENQWQHTLLPPPLSHPQSPPPPSQPSLPPQF